MKKLILLFMASVTLSACSTGDDAPESLLNVFVPVLSAEFPGSFTVGKSYNIKIIYSKPTRCHEFSGMDYENEENEFFIGIMNSYSANDPSCEEEQGLTAETGFTFTPEPNDFYIFNFWSGQNSSGEPEFLTKEIPVDPPDSENGD